MDRPTDHHVIYPRREVAKVGAPDASDLLGVGRKIKSRTYCRWCGFYVVSAPDVTCRSCAQLLRDRPSATPAPRKQSHRLPAAPWQVRFAEQVDAAMKQDKWKTKELAQKACVSDTTVRNIRRGRWACSRQAILLIARALYLEPPPEATSRD